MGKEKERSCSFCGVLEYPEEERYTLRACDNCGCLYCPRHGGKRHCLAHAGYNLPRRFKIFHAKHLAGASSTSRMGGYLKDMQQPIVRWKDDPSRIPVVIITSMKYHGVGVHWYVDITDDDNPCLDAEGHWCSPWDDKEPSGRNEGKKFDFETDIYKWVRRILLKWHPRGPVHLVFPSSDHEGVIKWFYKDGD
jgi:hypothetical protein